MEFFATYQISFHIPKVKVNQFYFLIKWEREDNDLRCLDVWKFSFYIMCVI
jgi:hypothetical protein